MSDIKKLIRLVRYDENLQRQEYPLELCDASESELTALRAEIARLRECEKLADEFYKEVRRVVSQIPYTTKRDFSRANELWDAREALKGES